MRIALHEIEPWLIRYQSARYNLAESGMANLTLLELLQTTGESLEQLAPLSFDNIDTRGTEKLRQAVAALHPGTTSSSILITHGTSEALLLYFQVRYSPGANVIVPEPAFQSLNTLPRYVGYEVRPLPLKAEDGFRLDLRALGRLVDSNTRIIIINTPHNPTGMVPTDEEMVEVRRIAASVGAEVLADEHYRFMPFDREGLLPSLYTPDGGVVAVGSMIKCLGVVGLRIGWLVGPGELLDACRDLKDYTTHTMCSVNDYLACLALQHWQVLAQKYRAWVMANVRRFAEFIDRHADTLAWVPPEAGIVAFPYLRDRDISTADYARRLMEEHDVFVLPGETFGSRGHFRIGFGLPPQVFDEALERWTRYIERSVG